MLDEIVDTNSNFANKEIPDGPHTFRVLNVRKNGLLYIWELSYDGGKEGEQVFFANTMGPLLKALGCIDQEKGKYHLQSEIVDGAIFKATVFREADKNDKTKLYQRMKDFQGSEVPY